MNKIAEMLINIGDDFNALAEELEKQHKAITTKLDALEYQTDKNKATLKNIAHTILNDLEG